MTNNTSKSRFYVVKLINPDEVVAGPFYNVKQAHEVLGSLEYGIIVYAYGVFLPSLLFVWDTDNMEWIESLEDQKMQIVKFYNNRLFEEIQIGRDAEHSNVMSIEEFYRKGFLQEVNRIFFHPLGMALSVTWDEKNEIPTGFGPIYHYNNDDEGMLYSDEVLHTPEALKKHKYVKNFTEVKHFIREKVLGYVIQKVE